MTTLREKLVKISAKVVRHRRYVTFQMADVAIQNVRVNDSKVLPEGDTPLPTTLSSSMLPAR